MKLFVSLLLLFSVTFAASNVQDSILNNFDNEYTIQKKKDFDPFKKYNILMTNLNDKFYIHILFPIAKDYKKVIPTSARNSVSNFFNNLLFPVKLINNFLQLKFKNSFDVIQRFIINSTIGIGGIYDVAQNKFHIKEHNEDFGQTLGYYGIGGGFYIVWPMIGPSNLRDTIGSLVDAYIDPKIYISQRGYNIPNNIMEGFAINSLNVINKTSFDYKTYEAIKQGNVMLYPILKDLYEKHRKKLISE